MICSETIFRGFPMRRQDMRMCLPSHRNPAIPGARMVETIKIPKLTKAENYGQRAERLKKELRVQNVGKFNEEFAVKYVHNGTSIAARVLAEKMLQESSLSTAFRSAKVPVLTAISIIRAAFDEENYKQLESDVVKFGRKQAIRSYCARMAGVAGNSALAEATYRVMYSLLANMLKVGALWSGLFATAAVGSVFCFLQAYRHGFHAGSILESIRQDLCSTATASAIGSFCIPTIIAGGMIALVLGWFAPEVLPQPKMAVSWSELWMGMLEALGLKKPGAETEYIMTSRIETLLREEASDMLCPITLHLMRRPASLHGEVYEYDAIHDWILMKGKDIYHTPASVNQIEAMPSMRALIQEFAEEYQIQLGDPDEVADNLPDASGGPNSSQDTVAVMFAACQ